MKYINVQTDSEKNTMKKCLYCPVNKFHIKRGNHHIHHAIFFDIYAGCLIYLYGHFFTIHLFVKLLAFSQRDNDARE